MSDDRLEMLSKVEVPPAAPAARRRALEAAMSAFDDEQARKFSTPAQGTTWADRLRSIVHPRRGNWTMDTRFGFGIGTAAIALLMLPLGYQLYTTTALTPPALPLASRPAEPVAEPQIATTPAEVVRLEAQAPGAGATLKATEAEGPVESHAQAEAAAPVAPAPAGDAALRTRQVQSLPVDPSGALSGAAQPSETVVATEAPALGRDSETAPAPLADQMAAAPSPVAPMLAAPPPPVGGMVAPGAAARMGESYQTMPLRQGAPSQTQPSGDVFTGFEESPVKTVAEAPVSTFSIDVDTASYTYARRALEGGWLPEPNSVRVEEMINYFSYDYPAPTEAGVPFQPTVSVFPSPWSAGKQLIHIGIKGYEPPADEDRASNLVFLLDTSGSMDEPDKLPLLKRAFSLLVDQLSDNDTVSIVVYAGSAGVVLEPTPATQKARILGALDKLMAGGSTAGADGIQLAYRMAEEAMIEGGINRVILATDGDFNVGIADPEALETFIRGKRDSGIFLSVLGFGQGNLGDDTMQALAQNGNGNAAYIDSFREAQRVLVAEGGGTLETIAKDVKIQVEFNPALVSEYRLIGYETRALNREDFNNDRVDAGDIGAGHTVTAIYEITPAGAPGLVDPLRYGERAPAADAEPAASDEYGFLRLRYKLPEEDESRLIEVPITRALAVDTLGSAGVDDRFAAAVAAFGQKLRNSNYFEMSWSEIRSLAQGARGADEDGYRAEFIQLIDSAAVLDRGN